MVNFKKDVSKFTMQMGSFYTNLMNFLKLTLVKTNWTTFNVVLFLGQMFRLVKIPKCLSLPVLIKVSFQSMISVRIKMSL